MENIHVSNATKAHEVTQADHATAKVTQSDSIQPSAGDTITTATEATTPAMPATTGATQVSSPLISDQSTSKGKGPSRKRPGNDPNERAPNPTKQRAGQIGAIRKAEKRSLTEAAFSDDAASPAPKRERTGSEATGPIQSIEGIDLDVHNGSGSVTKPRGERVSKGKRLEMEVTVADMVVFDEIEFIDQEGRKFVVRYSKVTTQERDLFWSRLIQLSNQVRQQLQPETIDSCLSTSDLSAIKLEHVAYLVPALVTNDNKLRVRKQQDKFKTISSKSVLPYLRKIEKAANQTAFLSAEGPKEQLPPPTTQTKLHTKLLQLPKSERTISLQEHNDILEGYEFYLGHVAEKLRLDLAFLHFTTESFVEVAAAHEKSLSALCMYIENAINDSATLTKLPRLAIEYASPGSHPCQCQVCSPDITAAIKQQLVQEVRQEVKRDIEQQVTKDVTDQIAKECTERLAHDIETRLRIALEDEIRREMEQAEVTKAEIASGEAAERAKNDWEVDQEWNEWQRKEDVYATEVAKHIFRPVRVAKSNCFCGYRREYVCTGIDISNPPRHWYDLNNLDSRCSLMKALEAWKEPIYDLSLAHETLDDRLSNEYAPREQAAHGIVEMDANGEPTPEWIALLDDLRKQAEDALTTPIMYEGGHQLTHRKELESMELSKTKEWESLLERKQLGWPEDDLDLTEAEEKRQKETLERKAWQDRVDRVENRNREMVEKHLKDENLRRLRLRPDATKATVGIRVDIPRALIELSPSQLRDIGTEPPRPCTHEQSLLGIRASVDSWRDRYQSSRLEMERDPVTWISRKRGPTELSKEEFDQWASETGYNEWASKVKKEELNATQAFVLWEQSVGASEADKEAESVAQFNFSAEEHRTTF